MFTRHDSHIRTTFGILAYIPDPTLSAIRDAG